MTTYQTKPVTVHAIQYDAPDGESHGNVAAVNRFAGVDLLPQTPWAPEFGQNCLLIPGETEIPAGCLRPGDYLLKDGDTLAVCTADEFEAGHELPEPPAKTELPK